MDPTLATFSSPCIAVLPLKSLPSSSSSALLLAFPSPNPPRLRACSDPVPVTVVKNEPALPVEKEADDLKPKQTSSLYEEMKALLADMGQTEKARRLFDEILQSDPFGYETLYEYALLIDRCGEEEVVLKRLEGVVALAEREKKAKEARDVRFIISQLYFLQNSIPLISVK
ncbi:hypothetical protein F3Y22_tig00117056pilonHSYRG01166 [Hibiscus syriacus]|uniref:Uncharacterized protein n=1 Tax=Hibiscus syriacus TaxID=106335 RepID=A0A6A2WWW9_HIBSY|nr:hypothetical protein F3Y22_tig00117056pilonHSYRG01166 [Hibiscus syriacus]